MGNVKSNVSSGVKEQAAGVSRKLYNYINMAGSGELVEIMKKCTRSKDFTEIDDKIKNEIKEFLYNDGEGKYFPVQEIVEGRCGRPGPKRENGINNVRDLEAMTSDSRDGEIYNCV